MKWAKILAATGFLVALMGYLSWDIKKEEADNEKAFEEKRLLAFDFTTVETFSLTNDNGTIRFVPFPESKTAPLEGEAQTEGAEEELSSSGVHTADKWKWRITEPFAAEADYSTVRNILTTLKDYKLERVVTEEPASLAAFGLATPKAKVEFVLKGGKKYVLSIGNKNPDDSELYFNTSDSKRVVLGSTSIDYLKKRSLKDFRDKKVASFKNNEVTQVDFASAGKVQFSLAKKDGDWQLLKPFVAKASTVDVEALLSDIHSLQATDFPSEEANKDAKKFGLHRPLAEITVTSKASDATEASQERIIIGKAQEKDDKLHVRVASKPTVFAMRKNLADKFDLKANKFVSREIGDFDQHSVASIKVSGRDIEDETILERQEDDTWKMVKPAARADSARVDSLLQALDNLKGETFVARKPGSAHKLTSIKQLKLWAELTSQDKKTVVRFRFSQPTTKKGDEDPLFYVQAGADQFVYTLNKADYDKVAEPAKDLRDRRMVPITAELASYSVAQANQTVTVKSGDKGWQITKQENIQEKEPNLSRLNTAIKGLRAATFLTNAPAANSGLEGPETIKIEATTKDGAKYSIAIGSESKQSEGFYAKVSSSSDKKVHYMVIRKQEPGRIREVLKLGEQTDPKKEEKT